MAELESKKTDFTNKKAKLGSIGQQLFEIGKLQPQAVDLEDTSVKLNPMYESQK